MSDLEDAIRKQAVILGQREVELSRIRQLYARAISWSTTYQSQVASLDTTTTPQSTYETWANILVQDLEIQSVVILQTEGLQLRAVARQPPADTAPIEDLELLEQLRTLRAGFHNGEVDRIQKLGAMLGLHRFLFSLIAPTTNMELLVVAGFDARVSRYRVPFIPEDVAHFQWITRHLESLIKNVLLVQAFDTQRRELESRLSTILAQSELIRQLSMPVLEIWEGILVLPLIGTIDAARGQELIHGLLQRLAETRARCVIIDVTGVETVDNQSAGYLIRVTRAASLLGVRCVLSGVSATIARTLVDISVSLGELRTFRDLRAGLKDCMQFLASGAVLATQSPRERSG